jgi:hypothetical protein
MRGELRADAKLADLRNSNAAVIAIDSEAKDVAGVLGNIDGITAVDAVDETAGSVVGVQRWRVTSGTTVDLCPVLFEALRQTSWRIHELRPEPKTLERVFRDLAERSGEEVAR